MEYSYSDIYAAKSEALHLRNSTGLVYRPRETDKGVIRLELIYSLSPQPRVKTDIFGAKKIDGLLPPTDKKPATEPQTVPQAVPQTVSQPKTVLANDTVPINSLLGGQKPLAVGAVAKPVGAPLPNSPQSAPAPVAAPKAAPVGGAVISYSGKSGGSSGGVGSITNTGTGFGAGNSGRVEVGGSINNSLSSTANTGLVVNQLVT